MRRANTISSSRRTRSTDEKLPPQPQPPVPPLPTTLIEKSLPTEPVPIRTLHPMRVFISDTNRFVNIEIEETTTAGDIVDIIRSREEFRAILSVEEKINGFWMLWEQANDLDMRKLS